MNILSINCYSLDWKVCIAQSKSRLHNFGPSARPGAQILEIFFSGNIFSNIFCTMFEARQTHRNGMQNMQPVCCVPYGG